MRLDLWPPAATAFLLLAFALTQQTKAVEGSDVNASTRIEATAKERSLVPGGAPSLVEILWDPFPGALYYRVYSVERADKYRLVAETRETSWLAENSWKSGDHYFSITAVFPDGSESTSSRKVGIGRPHDGPYPVPPPDSQLGSSTLGDLAKSIRANLSGKPEAPIRHQDTGKHYPSIGGDACFFCHQLFVPWDRVRIHVPVEGVYTWGPGRGLPERPPPWYEEWHRKIARSTAGFNRAYCLACHDGTYAEQVDAAHGKEAVQLLLAAAKDYTPHEYPKKIGMNPTFEAAELETLSAEAIPCTACHKIHALGSEDPALLYPRLAPPPEALNP